MLEITNVYLTKTLLALFLIFLCVFARADETYTTLKFSYWDDATPPFMIERDGVVQGGIIKDLAEEISSSLSVKAEFVKLPVTRIEHQLKEGYVDIDCITSPIWKESPGEYDWSPLLFESFDRFMVRMEGKSLIRTFADLKNMRLGIYNGYIYHPDIMSMIKSGDVETVKLHGVEHGIKLLKLGRIDAFVDFGILLNYQIKTKNLAPQLVLADLPADQYKLHCAYSKKMAAKPEVIDSVINNIIRSGKLDEILKRYR